MPRKRFDDMARPVSWGAMAIARAKAVREARTGSAPLPGSALGTGPQPRGSGGFLPCSPV